MSSTRYLRWRGREQFAFNKFQCTRLATACKEKIAELRQTAVWQNLDRPECQFAFQEYTRATQLADSFLDACSSSQWGKYFIARIDTGEAYQVHLHDLLWSIAALDITLNHFSGFPTANLSIDRIAECEEVFRDNQLWNDIDLDTRYMMDKLGKLDFMYRNLSLPQKLLLSKKKRDLYRLACFLFRRSQGTQLENCRIDPMDISTIKRRRIGGGGFGTVYQGEWFGQSVAIKEFNLDSLDALEMEAKIQVSLKSPYIIQLIGWSSDEKAATCSLLMELGGPDLRKLIKQKSHRSGKEAPFPLHVAIDIMYQISRGMEYVHNRNVAHRDLKPSNVLVESTVEGFFRVKLTDFGEAKFKEDSSQLTTDKKGTLYYRAPEVFREAYTQMADVYSFGVTCFEILEGELPKHFPGLTFSELQMELQNGRRPILSSACPSYLTDLIGKCWHMDPGSRPSFTTISRVLRYVKFILSKVNYVNSHQRDLSESHKLGLAKCFFLDALPSVLTLAVQRLTKLEALLKNVISDNHIVTQSLRTIHNRLLCGGLADVFSSAIELFRSRWPYICRGDWAQDLRKCQKAVLELHRLTNETEAYLQECSKLEGCIYTPEEASEVHLENFLLCLAGLDVALHNARGLSTEEVTQDWITQSTFLKVMATWHCDIASNHNFNEELKSILPDNIIKFQAFLTQKLSIHVGPCLINTQDIDKNMWLFCGQGNFAVVFETKWLGHRVVVKTYKNSDIAMAFGDNLFPAAIGREIRLFATLRNPYIIHLFGWYRETKQEEHTFSKKIKKEERICIVEEFVTHDLASILCDSEVSLSLDASVDIMLQISKAVQFLQSKGLYHGGLNPSRVRLEPCKTGGGYYRVKLRLPYFLVYSSAAGVSCYTAPELLSVNNDRDSAIVTHDQPTTEQCDMFSFGMTCYAILARGTPLVFSNASAAEIRRRIQSHNRQNLDKISCPSPVLDMIRMCWDPHPKDRPTFASTTCLLRYVKFVLLRINNIERTSFQFALNFWDFAQLGSLMASPSSAANQEHPDQMVFSFFVEPMEEDEDLPAPEFARTAALHCMDWD